MVIYPVLFAIYPILYLWSSNIGELSIYSSSSDLLVPMALSAGLTIVALAISRIVWRDWGIAGLFVAFLLLLFYSYGYVQEFIAVNVDSGYSRNLYLVAAWPVIFVVGALLLFRYRSSLDLLTNPLNVTALILVIFTLPNAIGYESVTPAPLEERVATSEPTPLDGGTLPDIYYITAETYPSEKVLKRYSDIDISPFTDFLQLRGFYVAADSNANHSNTVMSLASSHNMETYENITLENDPFKSSWDGYYHRLQDNKAMRFARDRGYDIYYLRSRFPSGSEELGDVYYGCDGGGQLGLRADGFFAALMHTTALQPMITKLAIFQPTEFDVRLCNFIQIVKAKDLDGPKVVAIHMYVPGGRKVLGRDGEAIPAGGTITVDDPTYPAQLAWTNEMLQWVVDSLLSDPDYSPVIVIQGDHGHPGTREIHEEELIQRRMGIMNAYYLPNGGDSLLYPSISPVNTFRVIFNYYLGADFELLEDKSYFGGPYDVVDVTDIVRKADGE